MGVFPREREAIRLVFVPAPLGQATLEYSQELFVNQVGAARLFRPVATVRPRWQGAPPSVPHFLR